VGRRQLDRVRGRSCSGLLHDDGVLQPGILAEFLANGLAQQIHVVLLQPLIEELGRDLNGQNRLFQLDRFDRNEPRLKSLGADIVFDKGEAICPDTFVIQVHSVQVM